MKKEKLSLKSIKQVLTRGDMKKIMGGTGSSGCDNYLCGGLNCRYYTNGFFVCSSCCG